MVNILQLFHFIPGYEEQNNDCEGESSHHGEKEHFQWGLYRKNFKTHSQLNMHERAYDGENPFKCGICDKTFSQNILLEIHKLLHAEEKPFKYEFCQKTFKTSSNLKHH